jgi:hypothetical protein
MRFKALKPLIMPKPGTLRFCVVATDPAGNHSAASRAGLRIA